MCLKIKNWIYRGISYDKWHYNDGETVLTHTFIFFGSKYQKEITDEGKEYMLHMSGVVNNHHNCE